MEQVSVYEAIANVLKENEIDTVYGLPSDDLQLMNAIEDCGIEFLVNKDQRNAVFMATGYALAAKRLGVCIVGKGPAVSNCVTGLLEAHSQNAPVLIIASGTRTQTYGSQRAFQETNQMSLVSPLVKWCHRVETPDSIGWVLKRALFLALNGKPGPIYIEIPEDIGELYINLESVQFSPMPISRTLPNLKCLDKVKEKLVESQRPLLLLGGGSKSLTDNHLLTQFANTIGASVFVTASGRGAYDENQKLFCGLAGLYCPKQLFPIVQESDLVITVGSKLEETALFGWEQALRTKEVIQINIVEEDFNLDFSGLRLVGDVGLTLKYLISIIQEPLEKEKWIERIEHLKQSLLVEKDEYLQNANYLSVAHVLEGLQLYTPSNAIYVHENGLQDMWSYYFPYLSLIEGQNAIVPSEQTSLGFGVSAAVGVAKAKINQPVVAFVGDGAFNLFRSELETVINNRVPVIYVVLKNGGYGWLQFQNKNKERKNPLSFVNPRLPLVGIENPQLEVISLRSKDDVEDIFKDVYKQYNQGKTVILECMIQLEDVPDSLKEIYGDFPKKEGF
ncbi:MULTISPECIES: thiamine pyrophosphate-binding protein [unclassified Bacillus (in: firmicutes)]|uniref:thiamine pyrophosphate-binding protein n=1 Tax=unclassified Bacillus (in: firmicutes) TaxID=185979 RepID=UPI00232C8D90|nr:thiamine pyrophosphate-binding protein [Bacillus sp. BP-3]MDC2865524.1 thiamine pyrophosphate-binding protein [Bacillus sp. BP-3]